MDAATVAGIIAIIVAVGGQAVLIITTLKTKSTVGEVHKLVNGNLSDVNTRVAQLQTTMVDAGVPIPASAPPTNTAP